jgi:formate-dependent nitrite reductase membrane component NrfD
MENYSDLAAAILLGVVLLGLSIPLIGVLKHTTKEKKRLDEVKSAKKQVTEPLEEEDIHALM